MKSIHFCHKPVDDSASRVCVLFDPKNGHIVHIHGVTSLRGDRSCTNSQLEEITVSHAKSFGRWKVGMKTAHVPVAAIRQRGSLKMVDKGEKVIVAGPVPSKKEIAARRKQSNDRQ